MIRNGTGMSNYKAGDLVLLSTRNLGLKGGPCKTPKEICGSFSRSLRVIGQQAYRLSLPDEWKIHPCLPCLLTKGLEVCNCT